MRSRPSSPTTGATSSSQGARRRGALRPLGRAGALPGVSPPRLPPGRPLLRTGAGVGRDRPRLPAPVRKRRRRAGDSAGQSADELFGYAVHHAVRARFCVERGRLWQAEVWISALRDHALELACLQRGLPVSYGRGFDALPPELLDEGALVRSLDRDELLRALRVRGRAARAGRPRAVGAARGALRRAVVVPKHVGSSGPPWRLRAVEGSSVPRRHRMRLHGNAALSWSGRRLLARACG